MLSAIVFIILNFFIGHNVVPKHNLALTSFSSEWLLIATEDKETISNNSKEEGVEVKGDVKGVEKNEDKSDLMGERQHLKTLLL